MARRDNIAEGFNQKTAAIADRRIARMSDVASKMDTEMKGLLAKGEALGAVDVALAKAQIDQALTDAGYFDEITFTLNDDYRDALNNSFDQYKEIYNDAFLFADSSLDIMNTAKALDLDSFNKLGADLNTELTREVINFNAGAVTRRQAEVRMASLIDKYIGGPNVNGYAKTAIQDGIMSHYNLANTRLALDNGLTKFKYVGRLIKTSRDFCIQHLDQVHTMEEWNEIAAKWNASGKAQVGIPFEVGRGGHNCQHSLLAVA